MAALKFTLAQIVGSDGDSHLFQEESRMVHTPTGPVPASSLKVGDLLCLHAGDRRGIPIVGIELAD